MTMFNEVPQFVPQEVCLSCQGCCRFLDEKSVFRPKYGVDEFYQTRLKDNRLAQKIFSISSVDKEGYLKACTRDHVCQCHFFDQSSNRCTIYHHHPFECRLYPFLLTRKEGRVYLCVHLSCPYVQEELEEAQDGEINNLLRNYFTRAEVVAFLRQNEYLITDYSEFDKELLYLFEVPLHDHEPEQIDLLNKRFIFERKLESYKKTLASDHFIALFAWQDFFDFEFREIEGALCVFATHELGTFQYMPPLAENITSEVFDLCFHYMQERKGAGNIARIENMTEDHLALVDHSRYMATPKGVEYCYQKSDIVELKGNTYKSKRNAYNHFVENNKFTFEPFHRSDQEACLALTREWIAERKESHHEDLYGHMLEESYQTYARVMQFAEALGCVGRVVKVDGMVRAYSFGYPLNADTFCIFNEVADLRLSGLAVFIFREFCRDEALSPYTWINTMDDSGLESLKAAKLSWHPHKQIPIYTLKEK